MPKCNVRENILLYEHRVPYAGYRDTIWRGKWEYNELKEHVQIGVHEIPYPIWDRWLQNGNIELMEDDMGLTAKSKGNGFDLIPAGVHHAICYGVVDLGVQYSEFYNNDSHKVLILWELPNERIKIEGKDLPRAISKRFTLSLSSKAKLKEWLENWRGKPFSEKELEGFELKNLLKANCQLNIIHTDYKEKKIATPGAIMQLPKGTLRRDPENPLLWFSFEESPTEFPENMPEWISDIIEKSAEYELIGNQSIGMDKKMSENELSEEEDIPF